MNFFNDAASRKDVKQAQKGSVLIVVLWVVLAISLLALSFSASIRTEVDAARNVVEQKQSYYMARAGIEYAVYEILETQSAFYQAQQQLGQQLDAIPDVLRGAVSLELADGGADVRIIDESGKVNINLAPGYMIFNLLIMTGVPGEQADVITDSIADWVDPDELIREFGAESDYYLSLETPYAAKNGYFSVPEELLLVRGVTPEIYYGKKTTSETGEPLELYGLQNYVTTFSNVNQLNVNSAPLAVLASVPGLDYSSAEMIDEMRQGAPLNNVSEIAEQLPGIPSETMGMLGAFRSNIYTLDSVGRVNNSSVVSRIRSVIQIDGMSQKGYSIIYWNESNTEL